MPVDGHNRLLHCGQSSRQRHRAPRPGAGRRVFRPGLVDYKQCMRTRTSTDYYNPRNYRQTAVERK